MRHYIIDGNNVIGKVASLKKLQLKNNQSSREKLALMVERFFSKKNTKVSLHFDGYPKNEIRISKGKIYYSENATADEMIKKEIEDSKNPKNLVIVTSDSNLKQFANKCSCKVISSKEFNKLLRPFSPLKDEDRRIQELSDTEEFKKLFGIK